MLRLLKSEDEGARQHARDVDDARLKAEVEVDDLRLEIDEARFRELTQKAVRVVEGTPEGLPGGFMREDDTEIMRVRASGSTVPSRGMCKLSSHVAM